MIHQYVERGTGRIHDEKLFGDRLVRFLYGPAREYLPGLFRSLTSLRCTQLLGLLNYESRLGEKLTGNRRFLMNLGINLSECLDPPQSLDTARKIFERRIRYWETRPMPTDERTLVSPADARMLMGSLRTGSLLWIKEKFFSLDELLGPGSSWSGVFAGGDFAVFRLTPDKYHYNHVPASGVVADYYAIEGDCHACHPEAVVRLVTPYSKNRRVITVIDTDVPGGSQVGRVAMIEVVAMMIGRVDSCYSEHRYDDPRALHPGLFLKRGQPKSLYRPGSSTDVLLFERGRVRFAEDLVMNLHAGARSRFSEGFSRPLVETDVAVRSAIGCAADDPGEITS